MGSHVIFFGWDRPIPGREAASAGLFQEFTQYLAGLQGDGTIESFQPVFLNSHGGDLNGFILIQGDGAKLDAMVSSEKWIRFNIQAGLYLDGAGTIRGTTGDLLMEQMGIWTSLIPD